MDNRPQPPLRDDELVIGAILGNTRAWDMLARRFRGALVYVALQETGSHDMAEDVAQTLIETHDLARLRPKAAALAARF